MDHDKTTLRDEASAPITKATLAFVPREPTDAMLDAIPDALNEIEGYRAWIAMWDAAFAESAQRSQQVAPSGLVERSPDEHSLDYIADEYTQQTPLPAERDERAAFEAAFRTYFGSEPQPGFDQPADFWLERIDDGRYATTRVDDAWTGWKAAIASQAGERDA